MFVENLHEMNQQCRKDPQYDQPDQNIFPARSRCSHSLYHFLQQGSRCPQHISLQQLSHQFSHGDP